MLPILAGIVVVVCSLAGVALTILTLPGIWLAILAAGLVQWWHIARYDEPMFSWWTLGIAVGIGVVAELVEFLASAAGAAKAGGTRRGAVGSVVGGLVGAILGSVAIPVPILGTVVGAAAGAGVGAFALERAGGRKTWMESTKIGAGAAAGRLVATAVKSGLAGVIAVMLSVGAFV